VLIPREVYFLLFDSSIITSEFCTGDQKHVVPLRKKEQERK
jgi:hypothetical protein